MRPRPGPLLALLLLACCAACGGDPKTPGERLRAVLSEIERGAEANDVAAMKEHVSEAYGDSGGRDKRALSGLVALHLLQNRAIHLYTRVAEIDLSTPGEARADVVVAMAGSPIPSAAILPGLRADLYRFDLRFRDEEAEWRLVGAEWRRASLADFQ